MTDERGDGTHLSKDRISRIKVTAARVKVEVESRDEVVNEFIFKSFCFVHDDGTRNYGWGSYIK